MAATMYAGCVRRLLFSCNTQCLNTGASAHLSGFKSAYSLDKLYPGSNLSFTASVPAPSNENGFSGYIPIKELEISYSRSGGPGGQNVNKLNTKVDVRFHVATASWLPQEAKDGLLQKYRSRISRDGYLLVRSERTRSQHLNMADALDRIRYLVTDVLQKPKEASPESIEKHRRLHERATRERLREKRHRSALKRQNTVDF
ncbi:peptidyl-tRNA hydrolase ICT1, mitochondrial-like [Amphibalanus amphitrite]|uniref:peptidyl-tRNA hydrolase ICT1, mitochondrial-like n=1 Tax=Amphibalanus amphitrite TaxID=1232801 RepID=UPI001C915054|nr:peptidyl-tRNA hydrolase ICT1, mitochondrial-like [Amphibalanus amphitrite]